MAADCVLVFPPIWLSLSMPYLSLPALAAALRAEGATVACMDLNLEFARHLSRQNLWQLVSKDGKPLAAGHEKSLLTSTHLAPQDDGYRSGTEIYEAAIAAAATLKGLPPGRTALEASYFLTGLWSCSQSLLGLLDAAADPHLHLALPFLSARLEQDILPLAPRVIGFSIANGTQLIAALAMAEHAKAHANPSVVTVIGGPYCTLIADSFEACPQLFDTVDCVVVSHGERALCEIVEDPEKALGAAIPGVMRRDRCGKVVRAMPAPFDPEQLAVPDFSGLSLPMYDSFRSGVATLPLEVSRGCYWGRCGFCNYHSVNPGYAAKRPAKVADEAEVILARHSGVSVSFIDDVCPPPLLESMANAFVSRHLSFLWSVSSRVDRRFTRELCHLLRRAGCSIIFFGLESASDRLLALTDKGFDLATVRQTVSNFHSAGIVVAANLIVGLPTETEEETLRTLALAEELRLSREYLTVSRFAFARGSRFFMEADRWLSDASLRAMRESEVQTTFWMSAGDPSAITLDRKG